MVGWHHQHNGHQFDQAPGYGEGQGSLVCCNPWGCKDSDMTEHVCMHKSEISLCVQERFVCVEAIVRCIHPDPASFQLGL